MLILHPLIAAAAVVRCAATLLCDRAAQSLSLAARAAAAARAETELRDRTAELSSTLRARTEEAAQAHAAAARERKERVRVAVTSRQHLAASHIPCYVNLHACHPHSNTAWPHPAHLSQTPGCLRLLHMLTFLQQSF
jgi:hypothetical protein